jgi:hypothetical protein
MFFLSPISNSLGWFDINNVHLEKYINKFCFICFKILDDKKAIVFWARSTNHPSFNSTSTNLGEVQGDKLSSDGRLFAQKPLPFSRGAAASWLHERMLLMRHLHKQCCLPLKHDSSDLFLSNHAYIDALSLSLSLSLCMLRWCSCRCSAATIFPYSCFILLKKWWMWSFVRKLYPQLNWQK